MYSDSEKCELLNDHFASVFTQEDLSSVPSLYIPQIVDPLSDIEFTPQDVYEKLSTLKHQDLMVGQPYLLKSVDNS